MGSIRFLGRARGGRCVFCHDSLAGQVQMSDRPVLVYGLPLPAPYVIEFADGALALVHAD